MEKVDRLIKLDLMLSARTIPISLVEEKIRYYVKDSSLLKLISSFLNQMRTERIEKVWSTFMVFQRLGR